MIKWKYDSKSAFILAIGGITEIITALLPISITRLKM